MNTENEPVRNASIVKFVAGVIAMLAAKYLPALGLSEEQSFALATILFGFVVTVTAKITRSKVYPVAKVEAALKSEHPAAFAALARKP